MCGLNSEKADRKSTGEAKDEAKAKQRWERRRARSGAIIELELQVAAASFVERLSLPPLQPLRLHPHSIVSSPQF